MRYNTCHFTTKYLQATELQTCPKCISFNSGSSVGLQKGTYILSQQTGKQPSLKQSPQGLYFPARSAQRIPEPILLSLFKEGLPIGEQPRGRCIHLALHVLHCHCCAHTAAGETVPGAKTFEHGHPGAGCSTTSCFTVPLTDYLTAVLQYNTR